MQKYNPLRKGTVVIIIAIFIGVSIIPSIVGVEKSSIPIFTNPTIVSIQPPSQTVEKGEPFLVSVYIELGEPIIGAYFECLYFNPNLIHADCVVAGDLFDPSIVCPGTIDNENGEITDVYALIVGGENVTDDGFFVNITFVAQQQSGTSYLDLEGVIIANATGYNAPIEVYDGSVTVTTDYYTLTALTEGCGYVIPPGGVYPAGTIVCIEAIPCPYWVFAGWSGDITGTVNPTCLIMDGDKIIIAHFWYTLPIEINGCGNVTKDPNQSSYPVDTTVQLTAEPCPGWSFAYWSGDISSTENPTYININANMFTGVTANFDFTNPPQITDVTLTHSIPKDTSLPGNPACFSGGWENITCTVTDDGTLDVVQINFTYTYTYWGPWKDYTEYFEFTMNNIGDTYYYNTTLTGPGEYTYHIWANDTNGNHNSTLPETFFLPMNEDVDGGGKVHFMDLIAISLKYNQVGPCGWIRADVNNDGKVHFMDLVAVAVSI